MDADSIEQMLYERAIRSKIRAPRQEGEHRFTGILAVLGVLFLTNTFMTPADDKAVGGSHAPQAANPGLSGGSVPGASVSEIQHNSNPAIVSIAMSQIGH